VVYKFLKDRIMKQITILELTKLLGGRGVSSCAEVQYMANTHMVPKNPSDEERDAEERFWDNWAELFDRYCK